jgi:hypothetical protein
LPIRRDGQHVIEQPCAALKTTKLVACKGLEDPAGSGPGHRLDGHL